MGDGLPRVLEEPTPAPAPASTKVTCEFCGCQLGPSGEYMQLSERAKGLRQLEDSLSTSQAETAAARANLADALRERDEARAALAARDKDAGREDGRTLDVKW
jgi:hypothetical protein